MSEMIHPPTHVWGAPEFPLGGRLPKDLRAVENNHRLQMAEARAYQRSADANGRRRYFACCHALHVSLFFDGTNNNESNDAKKGHPSNIARLYHASIQDDEARGHGYFSYYIPGVGTPFPKMGELDYSKEGLKYARGGENRINWALMRIVSALSFAVTNDEIEDEPARASVLAMATAMVPAMPSFVGRTRRRDEIEKWLAPLRLKMQQRPPQPQPLSLKLYVYGFSRGAAEARTFVTWLSELFETPEGADKPEQTLLGLPVSVEFLGVLDTVASVGIAHAVPFFAGHMDWADDTQLLPDPTRFPGLIKQCRH
ncbi:phospholipase effector Tle1 domain-containing protein, partial [Pseudomonas sp. NPDC007930]|uniref:phospholipase effector Tle1 domain-containing protein n=1 Tax=Pseudomonas sp. NPDC007930 TaxID=3364417 RepID=UPI0036E670EB